MKFSATPKPNINKPIAVVKWAIGTLILLIGTQTNGNTTIFTVQDLSFEDGIAGFQQSITTPPDNYRAAIFGATGDALAVVTVYVVQNEIDMVNLDNLREGDITINNFITGGSIDNDGRGVIDSEGNLDGIQVGATANISSNADAGRYRGSATMRITYL